MMASVKRDISLGFTPERVPEGQHICYVYNDDVERRRTISKYLESGLLGGEKVLCLVDTMPLGAFAEAMHALGLDLDRFGDRVVLSEALPVYCPDGRFSCPEMLDVVGRFYDESLREGFAGSRGTGEMSWALVEGRARREDLMEYEARLNNVLQTYPYTACCQYDARRFDGQTIMDVLSVHPMMILRGQLVRNPFYVEPEVFLSELRRRERGCSCGGEHGDA